MGILKKMLEKLSGNVKKISEKSLDKFWNFRKTFLYKLYLKFKQSQDKSFGNTYRMILLQVRISVTTVL